MFIICLTVMEATIRLETTILNKLGCMVGISILNNTIDIHQIIEVLSVYLVGE